MLDAHFKDVSSACCARKRWMVNACTLNQNRLRPVQVCSLSASSSATLGRTRLDSTGSGASVGAVAGVSGSCEAMVASVFMEMDR